MFTVHCSWMPEISCKMRQPLDWKRCDTRSGVACATIYQSAPFDSITGLILLHKPERLEEHFISRSVWRFSKLAILALLVVLSTNGIERYHKHL